MKLRLNLSGQDLGLESILLPSVQPLNLSLVYLYQTEAFNLNGWPHRDTLLKTMPIVFRKHYPHCVVIIDCFDVFIDRPTDQWDDLYLKHQSNQ